ncbi:related to metalloprotease MEP1 [Serendipita indica DSM 11827]|uniref:Related to metalloprotease MEP1 n=1 Tax=Serendipita indica (strain DSM 11827) TaxID=1109443 RepID=G4T9U6_SERID|nr:related to metalloprotease MEP1 [Serendipita indica DSM 11827]
MRFTSLFFGLFALTFALAAPLANETAADGDVEHRGCKNSLTVEEANDVQTRFAADLAKANIGDLEPNSTRTAPVKVVWHIIYPNLWSGGYLSNSDVQRSISYLNSHYSGTGIQFTLTRITRTRNYNWYYYANDGNAYQTAMKNALRQGGRDTLNVYTVNFGDDTLGYATWPWNYAGNPRNDGVVIKYNTVPGGSSSNYNQGKTLTHEVGHWLGLFHVFQGQSCSGNGDYVVDTPPQRTPTYGCPTYKDSCPGGGPDSIHNFMDYSYDRCMYQFTYWQAYRARQAAAIYRGL